MSNLYRPAPVSAPRGAVVGVGVGGKLQHVPSHHQHCGPVPAPCRHRRYDDSDGISTQCGDDGYNEDVTIATAPGDVIAISTTWHLSSAAGDIALTVVCSGFTQAPSDPPPVRPTVQVSCGDTVTVNVAGNNDFWPFMLDLSRVSGFTQVGLSTCGSVVDGESVRVATARVCPASSPRNAVAIARALPPAPSMLSPGLRRGVCGTLARIAPPLEVASARVCHFIHRSHA